MCDKGMGMSLFYLETMRRADETLMRQLGAVRMEETKEEIMNNVIIEIEMFEDKLTNEQRKFLDSLHESRHYSVSKVKFPFLKSMHKIQKMTEEEIRNKDLSGIKFRPVVDAKQWLTRGYAGVAMEMMREATNTLVNSGGSVMRNLKCKDGWRFAVEIGDYVVEEEFDVMVTADIGEAYSNITDEMIKKAISIVTEFLGYEEWKTELMKSLVDLVLGQNYAETSVGLFKFKKILPMGYRLSGDALDIVAVAEEMILLYHLGENIARVAQVGIAELRNYPDIFLANDVQQELVMSRGIKKFRRFVDDTHSQIAGTLQEVLNGILAIGFLYPESLVITMKLNVWNSSFLDSFVWKNLLHGELSTVMKKDGDVPVGHVRRGSSHPEKYKLQSLLGEMLRGRRLATDTTDMEN